MSHSRDPLLASLVASTLAVVAGIEQPAVPVPQQEPAGALVAEAVPLAGAATSLPERASAEASPASSRARPSSGGTGAEPDPRPQEIRWFRRGWYAGASLGAALYPNSSEEFDQGMAARGHVTTTTVDQSDFGWKLYGGYRFEAPLALELSYVDLGQITSSITGSTDDPEKFLNDVADLHPYAGRGFGLGLLVMPYEKDRFSTFLKGGGWYWQSELEIQVVNGPTVQRSRDGFDGFFGLGVTYEAVERLDLRAEWERYFVDGEGVDLITLGLQYRF